MKINFLPQISSASKTPLHKAALPCTRDSVSFSSNKDQEIMEDIETLTGSYKEGLFFMPKASLEFLYIEEIKNLTGGKEKAYAYYSSEDAGRNKNNELIKRINIHLFDKDIDEIGRIQFRTNQIDEKGQKYVHLDHIDNYYSGRHSMTVPKYTRKRFIENNLSGPYQKHYDGVGTALFKLMQKVLQEEGNNSKYIELEADISDRHSDCFAEKMGFKRTGHIIRYEHYENGENTTPTFEVMVKQLPQ